MAMLCENMYDMRAEATSRLQHGDRLVERLVLSDWPPHFVNMVDYRVFRIDLRMRLVVRRAVIKQARQQGTDDYAT